jgi:hypothetical protein
MSILWRECDKITRGPSAQGFSPAMGKFKHQWRAVNGFTTGRQSPAAQRPAAAKRAALRMVCDLCTCLAPICALVLCTRLYCSRAPTELLYVGTGRRRQGAAEGGG